MKKCKEWHRGRDKDGYGRIKLNGKTHRVHRLTLELALGRKLDVKECVLHLCDNPSCYEVSHLKVGTVRENNQMRRDKQVALVDTHFKGWKKLYGRDVK